MKTDNRRSEKWLERELITGVHNAGGTAVKITASTINGLPDRLVLWPGGRAEFVELKSTGKTQTAAQVAVCTMLRDLEFTVTVIDNEKDLDQWFLKGV